MSAEFDPALPWQRARSVALRPEPFGALVYSFTTRKLSFLKSSSWSRVVEALGRPPRAPPPRSTACGVPEAQRPGLREGAGRPGPLAHDRTPGDRA